MRGASAHSSLPQLFEHRVNLSGALPALMCRADEGWYEMSWRGWFDRATRLAAGLVSVGVAHGDRVILCASTRLEWVLCDMAISMIGGVSVPIYPSSPPERVRTIVEECEPVVVNRRRSSPIGDLSQSLFSRFFPSHLLRFGLLRALVSDLSAHRRDAPRFSRFNEAPRPRVSRSSGHDR